MPQETLEHAHSKRAGHDPSAEELLEAIFLDLARRNLADTPSLLRGLGAALQILSTTVPAATSSSREVWNPQERDGYRSRKTWESWILRQRFPHLGDQ
jgi:hypothetical protein